MPLLVDEAHYVAGGENVVDQIATHRAAGLEPAFGLQYFAQLGSASEHQQKILKGVLNLLQSRFLFRMGDAQDAEEATRIAMAVYATMIRDDPDSRARLRVTPEQLLNFPNYFCLASWIANGTRAPAFTGQTYPLPDSDDQWADHHLAEQAERVGPYPERARLHPRRPAHPTSSPTATTDRLAGRQPSGSTSRCHTNRRTTPGASARAGTQRRGAGISPRAWRAEPFARWRDTSRTTPENGAAPTESADHDEARSADAAHGHAQRSDGQRDREPRREVRVDYEPPPPAAEPRRQPGPPDRRTPGTRATAGRARRAGARQPARARVPRPHQRDRPRRPARRRRQPPPPLRRGLRHPRAARPRRARAADADRQGRSARTRPAASHRPADQALPPRADRPTPSRHPPAHPQRRQTARCCTRSPDAASRSRRPASRRRSPASANGGRSKPGRALRLAHDLHALAWAIELHRLVGDVATDHWRTPRYATGRYPVPQAGSGRDRHPITNNEIPVPDGQAIIDLELKTFTEVKPDLSLELRIDTLKLTFDLLVELDLTSRPSYNHDKLLAYDAFLCGWSLAHPRYRAQGTRPAVVFVCPDPHAALALAREADEALTGRIGVMGTAAEHWYYPGRDHTFFAIEADIHHGDLSALALPGRPARTTRTPHRKPRPVARARRPAARDADQAEQDMIADRVLPETVIKPSKTCDRRSSAAPHVLFGFVAFAHALRRAITNAIPVSSSALGFVGMALASRTTDGRLCRRQ